MSELSRFSRDLLNRSRAERTPTRATRERVFHAVAAAGVLGAATAAAAPSLVGKWAAVAGKWWALGGVCVALVGGGAGLALQHDAAPTPAMIAAAHDRPRPVALRAPTPPSSALTPFAPDLPAPLTRSPPSPARERSPSAPKLDGLGTQLEQEVSLLLSAREAYGRGRADEALTLLAQHRSRFPKSQLTQERATLEVLALCRAGRVADAQRLAGKLRSGASTTLSGLEGSCAAPK